MKTTIIVIVAISLLMPLSAAATVIDTGYIVSEGYYVLPSRELFRNLVKVSSADDLNFGLRPDGKVILWGEDALGLVDIIDPEATYIDLSVGYLHVLLLHENGSIDAYSGPDTWFPLTPPEPNSGYTAVSAGSLHSLALRDNGSVESWGSNLGPVPEPNIGYTAIAAGHGTAYALRGEDGSIAVWGLDTYGQHDVPLPNSGFIAISAGDHFAVALRDDGTIEAWGYDDYGQLTLPVPNENFTAIAAGRRHALAVGPNGTVVGWGDNSQGQAEFTGHNFHFTQVSAGFYHSVGIKSMGLLEAWGRREDRACGVPDNGSYIGVEQDLGIRDNGKLWLYLLGEPAPDVPEPNYGFEKVQRQGTWTVALRGNRSIEAWGDNYSGQLNVPDPNSGYVDVSSGSLHSVALRVDGSIEAWGENWSGQCDIPDPDAEYIAVDAGSQRSGAVKADGSVSVWGLYPLGPAPTDTGYVDVALGRYHTMALHEDGHIDVWSAIAPPLAIPEPNAGFVAIEADGKTCVAQREDGTLVAWGEYIWESDPLFGGNQDVYAFSSSLSSVTGIMIPSTTAVPVDLPQANADGILLGAQPNPFNPNLTVWFTAEAGGRASIEVYDLQGRRVRDLWRGDLVAGHRRSAIWDGRNESGSKVASGTYLVKLRTDSGATATRKVSLVK